MSQIVLELKGISKTFPGVKALNEMQLQVYAGEVHALMGENGAVGLQAGLHRQGAVRR